MRKTLALYKYLPYDMPRDEITTLDYWLDGVNEETHSPVEVSGLFTYTYSFDYRGEQQKVVLHISPELYCWAKNEHTQKQKVCLSPKNFILKRLSATEQVPVYDELLGELRKIQDHYHLDESEYFELIVLFVQKAIWYDGKKRRKFLANMSLTSENFNSYLFGDRDVTLAQRFPVETLVEGYGMCLEKSLLLAALLSREGYAAAIFLFRGGLHAAVGVRVPAAFGWGNFVLNGNGATYAYIESTEIAYVGDCSYVEHENYLPTTIEIKHGEREYPDMEIMGKILQFKRQLTDNITIADTRSKKLEFDLTKCRDTYDSLEKQLYEMEKKMAETCGDDFERLFSEFSKMFRQRDDCVSQIKEIEDEYLHLCRKNDHDKEVLEYIMEHIDDKKRVIEIIDGGE